MMVAAVSISDESWCARSGAMLQQSVGPLWSASNDDMDWWGVRFAHLASYERVELAL